MRNALSASSHVGTKGCGGRESGRSSEQTMKKMKTMSKQLGKAKAAARKSPPEEHVITTMQRVMINGVRYAINGDGHIWYLPDAEHLKVRVKDKAVIAMVRKAVNAKVLAWKLVWGNGNPTWQFPPNEPAWARNLANATGATLVRVIDERFLLQNMGNYRRVHASGIIEEIR